MDAAPTPSPTPGTREVAWRLEDLATSRAGAISFAALCVGLFVGGFLVPPGELAALLGAPWYHWLLGVVLMVVATAASLVIHEGVHGLFIALFGARPIFGAGTTGGVPYLFAGAPGHHFTRTQFIALVAAPTLLVNPALFALIPTSGWGAWLVLPAAFHLSGCVGDWLMLDALRRHQDVASVEDTRDGMIMHVRV